MSSRYVLLFFIVQLLTPIRRTTKSRYPAENQRGIFLFIRFRCCGLSVQRRYLDDGLEVVVAVDSGENLHAVGIL